MKQKRKWFGRKKSIFSKRSNFSHIAWCDGYFHTDLKSFFSELNKFTIALNSALESEKWQFSLILSYGRKQVSIVCIRVHTIPLFLAIPPSFGRRFSPPFTCRNGGKHYVIWHVYPYVGETVTFILRSIYLSVTANLDFFPQELSRKIVFIAEFQEN